MQGGDDIDKLFNFDGQEDMEFDTAELEQVCAPSFVPRPFPPSKRHAVQYSGGFLGCLYALPSPRSPPPSI